MNDLQTLFDKFAEYKTKIESIDPDSIQQYIGRIKSMLEFLSIKNIDDLISITAEDVRNWLIYLTDELNNSAQTRNLKLTAVKELYKYLKRQCKFQIDEDILEIVSAKTKSTVALYLSKEEYDNYISCITNVRTRAMVEMFLTTGMRFMEILQITLTDIERGWTTIIGKGNKERRIYFTLDCIRIVNKYIDRKRNHIIQRTGVKTDLLFISNEGNPIDKSSFGKSLKHYAKKANIEWWEKMSPHKLRHSFITHKLQERVEYVDNNGNIQDGGLKNDMKTVSQSVGHTNLSTTNTYAHTKDDLIKKMMLGG